MRTFPLYALLSLGALLALGVYASRLGFLPGAWVGAGLGLYALLVLWGLRFGRHHALLGLGLFAYWFPPLAFLAPLLFALLFGRGLREKEQSALYGWALVWPALALLLVWHAFPTLYAFYLSLFERVNFLRPAAFAGLENYRILLQDPLFWRALGNTFWYVVFTVPVGLLLATGVAILLNTQVAFLGFYRTLYFLPYITALTAAAAVWRWIYHPEFGFLNWLLGTPGLDWLNTPKGVFALLLEPLGVQPQGFWAGPSLAFVAIMVMSVWHFLGYQVVILLAGLQAIPKEYYEAAELDGASFWQKHRLITWPLLSPTTFFLFTLGLIGAFQVFTQVYILTPTGGVLQDTLTLAFYLYNKGFRDSDFSYASAIAMVTFLLILVLTLIQRRVLERRVNYEI
ncbi:carbohydrate ABC transporter permease [Thermus antranikianii]|uniref:carbohydrate ABC transporter permease n=1 Tax=Thermus antranikianii TaxID=88190 RepID=UPI00042924C7|nr:sugar ABC transporter permease [Thermus antranikianii]